MTAFIDETGHYLARSFYPKPLVNKAIAIKYTEEGKPVVYKQRWFILAAYCLGYFTWNFHSYRTTPLISEYALYYDQPNEFQNIPNVGIDFMLIFESLLLLVLYPLGGMLVDKYGIQMIVYGTLGQAIATWWWFFSFQNYGSVIISKILSNIAGSCIASALLRISNNWFGEDQRAMAVAIGSLFASLGGGASLIISPLFTFGDDEINLNLKSCRQDELILGGFNLTDLPIKCNDIAQEAFCCVADTNIDALNFFMAMWATLVAFYTFIVTSDAPPTPPSKSGAVRKGPPFKQAMQMMFSHWNYTQICVADFLSSGPPLVLFSTVDRIFPVSVADYSTYVASGAFVLAIPVGVYFSKWLAKTHKFFELTVAGYSLGFIAWFIVTVLVFIDSQVTDYLVLFMGSGAIVAYVLWTVSVYELKMEYVFSSEFAIQGYVVAVGRTIINLSSSIFLAAIPPERYKGSTMTGRQFTFTIGAVVMFAGTVLAWTIPDKHKYLRKQYEEENDITVGELLNKNTLYSHPPGTVIANRKK